MALTSDELNRIETAFRKNIGRMLTTPDQVSKAAYTNTAALGQILINNGRGKSANEQGETPLGLMAKLSDRSTAFKHVVKQFDARPALAQR